MHQHLTPPAHHGQHQHHYSHHGPHYQPLVLSLSQPNQAASHPHHQQGPNNNSLLILNNQNGPQPAEHNNSIFRLTPPDGVSAHQNAGSGSNRSDTMDSSASSNSPLESASGASGASVAGIYVNFRRMCSFLRSSFFV